MKDNFDDVKQQQEKDQKERNEKEQRDKVWRKNQDKWLSPEVSVFKKTLLALEKSSQDVLFCKPLSP